MFHRSLRHSAGVYLSREQRMLGMKESQAKIEQPRSGTPDLAETPLDRILNALLSMTGRKVDRVRDSAAKSVRGRTEEIALLEKSGQWPAGEKGKVLKKMAAAQREKQPVEVPNTPRTPDAVPGPAPAPAPAPSPAPTPQPDAAPAVPELTAAVEQQRTAAQAAVVRCNQMIDSATRYQDIMAAEEAIDALRTIPGAQPQAVEAIIASLKAVMEIKRAKISQADQAFALGAQRIESWIAVTRGKIAADRARIDRMDFIDSSVSRLSGATGAIEATIRADEAFIANAQAARQQMQQFGSNALQPQTRINGIAAAVRNAIRQPNYSVANAQFDAARAALGTADSRIRAAAEWLPGGELGIAIADASINPNDPENGNKMLRAVALTAVDIIPIPGARAGANVGRRVAGRVGGALAEGGVNAGGRAVLREGVERTLGPDGRPS
jgi:hypothetical protein